MEDINTRCDNCGNTGDQCWQYWAARAVRCCVRCSHEK